MIIKIMYQNVRQEVKHEVVRKKYKAEFSKNHKDWICKTLKWPLEIY